MAEQSVSHGPVAGTSQEGELLNQVLHAHQELHAQYEHRIGPIDVHIDAVERLTMRLDQASAMLTVMMGEDAGQSFQRWNDHIQESYLMAMRGILSAARVDAKIVIDQQAVHDKEWVEIPVIGGVK